MNDDKDDGIQDHMYLAAIMKLVNEGKITYKEIYLAIEELEDGNTTTPRS